MLDALVHGLTDADAALGKLTDYFAQTEEPTILVFLGDHLPGLSLGGEDTLYTRLGYASSADTGSWDAEELKQMHSTDFLVEQLWGGTEAGGGELYRPGDVSAGVGGAAQAPVFPVGVRRYGGDDPLPGAAFRSRRRHPLPHASRELRTPGGGVAQHRL